MAYLDPETLTCKSCGKMDDLVWVIGVGPHSKRGDPPSYIDVIKPGPWAIKKHGKVTQVFCPNCNELIVERAP